MRVAQMKMKFTSGKLVSIVELHSTILLDKSNDTQNSTSFAVRENFESFHCKHTFALQIDEQKMKFTGVNTFLHLA